MSQTGWLQMAEMCGLTVLTPRNPKPRLQPGTLPQPFREDPCPGGSGSPGAPWLVVASLQPPPASSQGHLPSVPVRPHFLLLWGHQSYWIMAYPNDVATTRLHLQRLYFQVRSQSKVLGLERQHTLADTIQPITVVILWEKVRLPGGKAPPPFLLFIQGRLCYRRAQCGVDLSGDSQTARQRLPSRAHTLAGSTGEPTQSWGWGVPVGPQPTAGVGDRYPGPRAAHQPLSLAQE